MHVFVLGVVCFCRVYESGRAGSRDSEGLVLAVRVSSRSICSPQYFGV